MLCGDLAVMQAPGLDSLSFDPFSLFQDGLSPSEKDFLDLFGYNYTFGRQKSGVQILSGAP